jgi:hypothetical protein
MVDGLDFEYGIADSVVHGVGRKNILPLKGGPQYARCQPPVRQCRRRKPAVAEAIRLRFSQTRALDTTRPCIERRPENRWHLDCVRTAADSSL